MNEHAKKAIAAVLLLLSGSRLELYLQQEGVVSKMCVAEQGPTYLDSGALAPDVAAEVQKVVRNKR